MNSDQTINGTRYIIIEAEPVGLSALQKIYTRLFPGVNFRDMTSDELIRDINSDGSPLDVQFRGGYEGYSVGDDLLKLQNLIRLSIQNGGLDWIVSPEDNSARNHSIRYLDVSDNQIGSIYGDRINYHMRDLDTLDVSSNYISFLDIPSSVVNMIARDNEIVEIDHRMNLKVEYLDLSRNRIRIEDPDDPDDLIDEYQPEFRTDYILHYMQTLIDINLSWNPIEYLNLDDFRGVRRLNLSNSDLHTLDFDLEETNLRYIDIRNTLLEPQRIDELMYEYPDIEIII